jgi:type VI secretion system secreted protein VgrG
VQTGTITGHAGEEVHTDEQGRVRVFYRFDRTGETDESSSTMMRVMHPASAGGFMLPRVGWEALVAFEGKDADRAYVLGRLDNGAQPPAETLPEHKARTSFGTPTTPGGGSQHCTQIDDTGGGHLSFVASKDYNEATKKNKTYTVKGDDRRTVGAKQQLKYESNHSLKIDCHQSTVVSGDRSVTAGGGMVVDAGSESVVVGGARIFDIGGDYSYKVGSTMTRIVGGAKGEAAIVGQNRHVSSVATMLVGGAWTETGLKSAVTVGGASALQCGSMLVGATSKHSVKVSGAMFESNGSRTVTSGSTWLFKSGAAMKLDFDSATMNVPTVIIRGKSSVTLSGGGAKIEVKPGQVTITTPFTAGGACIATKGKVEHE